MMTDLADEIVWLLRTSDEARTAESMPNILTAIGYGTERVPVEEVEAALVTLVEDGRVALEFRRGRRYFRAAASPFGP